MEKAIEFLKKKEEKLVSRLDYAEEELKKILNKGHSTFQLKYACQEYLSRLADFENLVDVRLTLEVESRKIE